MKIFKIISIIILSLFIVFMGCTLEEPDVKKTESNTGSYDLTRYVAIGNSLTAGFQSGSLVDVHQQYSFPKLIAGQLGIGTFEQPTVSYPGMPNIMVLESLTGDVGYAEGTGAPTNSGYGAPYDNLGIPGIVLADVLTALTKDNSLSHSDAIDLVLRNPTLGDKTVFQQAKMLQPTFITMWIGNNDVLGFATSGGVSPIDPTPSVTFQFLYNQLADSIAGLGATVAVATIPDVTDIPFFTTIGPMMVAGIKAAMQADTLHQIQGLFYQKHGEIVASGLVDSTGANAPLITLLGGQYTDFLGMPTGKWYRDLAATLEKTISEVYDPLHALGIDSTQAFGFHPQNPWPDALTLDADEVETAQNAITDFNGFIETAADTNDFALFDAYTFFGDVAENNYAPDQADLDTLTAAYISGGLFSLDGVHPSNVGYAVLANEFIKAINAKFDINITEVNLRNVMGGAQAPASLAKYNINNLSNTVEVLGGKIK